MTRAGMTVERVFELIAAYGSAPESWPEGERAAALAMVEAQSDVFAPALAQARVLDAALQDEPEIAPAADLVARILADAPVRPVPARAKANWLGRLKDLLLPQGTRWPAGATLASLAIGLVGGYAYASAYDQADQAYYTAFGYDAGVSWLGEEIEE